MLPKNAFEAFACGALGLLGIVAAVNACSNDNGSSRTGNNTMPSTTDATMDSNGGSSSGGGSSSSSGGTPDASSGDVCGLPMRADGSPGFEVYTGGSAAVTCGSSLSSNFPSQTWFGYDDGTSEAGSIVRGGAKGGCAGSGDCAFHASGSGFTSFGAGVGFTLNGNLAYDASKFTGLSVWMKGTTTGTRGLSYTQQDNTVHVKFVTGFNDGSTSSARKDDDYGSYCSIAADGGSGWVQCLMPFDTLTRDGFRGPDAGVPDPTMDMFDPQNLAKVQFEMSLYNAPDGSVPQPVSFDILIDDIAFF